MIRRARTAAPAHAVRVTIGDCPAWTFTAAMVDRERWNGWLQPLFTEAEGQRVAAVSRAEWERDPEATQEWVRHDPAAPPEARFVLETPDGPWTVYAQNYDGVWLYAIGSANWTWEAAADARR